MGALFIPSAFDKQPLWLAKIDRKNPLTRGLVVAVNGATRFDHARQLRPSIDTAANAPGGGFLGMGFDGSSSTKHKYTGSPIASGDATLFSLSYPTVFNSDNTVFALSSDTTDSGLNHYYDSSGNVVANAGFAGEYGSVSGSTISSNMLAAIVSTHTSTTNTVRVNNSAKASASNGVSLSGLSNVTAGYMDVSGIGGYEYITGKFILGLAWSRILQDQEATSIIKNPWQVFEQPPRFISIPATGEVQLLSPISDVSDGDWLPSTGTDLYATVDEASYSDTDYIYATSATTCTLALATGSDPAVSTGHTLRYRLLSGSGTVTVTLKQTSTTIASWGPHTLTGTAQDFAQTLTGGQADSITDYSALRVEITSA